MKNLKKVTAINFHLWKACNFKCKYCFATYDDSKILYQKKRNLSKEEMFEIVRIIAANGIEKISFVGGEPMLCKWLDELIILAKDLGLTTMIVTNGYYLDEKWIKKIANHLDWITISIDSVQQESQLKIGRAMNKNFISEEAYIERVNLIKKHGIRFKMNTVVNSINYKENLIDFVSVVKPFRWKIFQVLPIKNQSKTMDKMIVNKEQFDLFTTKHEFVTEQGITYVIENNDLMTNSYLMIDPLGRLYDNTNLELNYSKPILEVGFNKATEAIYVNEKKFLKRGGKWDYKKPKELLLIDMDGVLAELGDENFETDKMKKGFFLNKKPIKGAIDAFKLLSSIYDCHIVSTPVWSNPECWKEKRIWIEKHIGKEASKKLTLTHHKHLFKGNIIIDDSLRHGVDKFEGIHIHFGQATYPNWEITLNKLLK